MTHQTTPYAVSLPVYTGPLDLLLQLVEREELDITKVALAQVTDQYLAHIRQLDAESIEAIADFLVIAAKLILIKSQVLLPRSPEREAQEELDPGDELARQLDLYRQFKEVAGQLDQRQVEGLHTYLRVATPPKPEAKLDLAGVSAQDLWSAMTRILALLPEDTPTVSAVVGRRRASIRSRITSIAAALRAAGRARFFDLLAHAESRDEVVVTFLAILELIKQNLIAARQDVAFGDIEIVSLTDWVHDEQISISAELDDEL